MSTPIDDRSGAYRRPPTQIEASELWNLVPDALLAVESSGRIAAANDAATNLFGGETEGLVGRPVEALMDERARAGHVRERHRWTMDPVPRLMGEDRVFPARTLDGRSIEVQVALNPISLDGRHLTIAVIRDVTRNIETRHDQAIARDEIVQRLFGLGMSLRSVIPAVDETETAGRIAAVVDGMSEVVDALDDSHGRHLPPPEDER